MAIEDIRQCGYRKVGGMYFRVAPGSGFQCDQLPFVLASCECCGFTPKIKRGYSYLNSEYFKEHEDCGCTKVCPICHPEQYAGQRYLGMRVSSRYYTPEEYFAEAARNGVSLRTSSYPKDFEMGKTWILLSHAKAGTKVVDGEEVACPAIFFVFQPDKLEKLIWQSDATTETLAELEAAGITPVIVPDGDSDHSPDRSIRDDIRLNAPEQTSVEEEAVIEVEESEADVEEVSVVSDTVALEDINGLGPALLERFREAGVADVAYLAEMNTYELADLIVGVGPSTAERYILAAKALIKPLSSKKRKKK